ncbi:MAG: hypothetical protein AB1714_21290 [Acidobacteriota bacterium]
MRDLDRMRERFMRDPLPRRLGGLSASLARIASCARRETGAESALQMMDECRYYIEWSAADADPDLAAELVDIQVELALWRRIWTETQPHPLQRTLLSFQAKKWADRVLDHSGLLV